MIWAGYGVKREAAMAARQAQTVSLNQVMRVIPRRWGFMAREGGFRVEKAGLSGGVCP